MPSARTGPLRRRLARTLPSRLFAVRFWDRTLPPATNGDGATFTVRSPAGVARALPAPRQLGIGRAYVAGLLEVDDLDAALDLLAEWQPPPPHRSITARLALAAVCTCGLTLRPPCPGGRAAPARPASQPGS
jgi:hypothetical protein